MKIVLQYKYLGAVIAQDDVDTVCQKEHQCMFFNGKLQNLTVRECFIDVFLKQSPLSLLCAGTGLSPVQIRTNCGVS